MARANQDFELPTEEILEKYSRKQNLGKVATMFHSPAQLNLLYARNLQASVMIVGDDRRRLFQKGFHSER
ncbi:hypothetical protein HPP92_015623 [Vanilla planifolia]|uniref:Uncharacterized protein n=1 Tax=Vanilla planifolia TaxID=51239 RepID=A0A835QI89_VANPL|nr:hypothetical protein HPP92_015623 [Vanilla planifolia]